MHIVFEGAEATGKSTLLEELSKSLTQRFYMVHTRHLPNEASFYGNKARSLLNSPELTDEIALQISLLSFMDQYTNCPKGLYPDDYFCLDSRGMISTLVYSDLNLKDKGNSLLYDLIPLARRVTPPDLVVYLDPPIDFIEQNLKRRPSSEINIYDQLELIESIQYNYKEVLGIFPELNVLTLTSTDLKEKKDILLDYIFQRRD